MRIPQTYLQNCKAGLHVAQAFLVFVAGCLSLAVLTKAGGIGGKISFFFALCFLTLPALVYQVVVPAWTRAWRFANAYAYAALDLLFTLLWFAAFVAVAVWNAQGIKEGASDTDTHPSSSSGTCADFAYGSKSKCETGKAALGFGALIFLLFATTSIISIYGVLQYRKTGVMPTGHNLGNGRVQQVGAEEDYASKDAWSTSTDYLDHTPTLQHPLPQRSSLNPFVYPYQGVQSQDGTNNEGLLGHYPHRERTRSDGMIERSSTPDTQTEDGLHPGTPLCYGSSQPSLVVATPAYDEHFAPSALSPTGYGPQVACGVQMFGGQSDRLHFPEGNYGRL